MNQLMEAEKDFTDCLFVTLSTSPDFSQVTAVFEVRLKDNSITGAKSLLQINFSQVIELKTRFREEFFVDQHRSYRIDSPGVRANEISQFKFNDQDRLVVLKMETDMATFEITAKEYDAFIIDRI